MENEVRISKKKLNYIIFGTIAVIIVAVVLAFLFANTLQKHEKTTNVNNIKKALYDSLSCQYSCPLTNQLFQNKTQLMPSADCVKACTAEFKSLNISVSSLSEEDANNDNFLVDMSQLVTLCKDSAIISSGNATLPELNNTQFFNCVKKDLSSLKGKYSYLK